MSETPARLRPFCGWPAACVLLAVFALLAFTSAERKSVTFDEVPHLTAGLSYWLYDDYRLHPENGNWPQRLVALPAWLGGVRFPDLDQPSWQRSEVYPLGQQLFFSMGNDIDRAVRRGRALMILVGVGLGAAVYAMARRLFGAAGGIVALLAYTFDPNLLAHARLMTSDLMAALFFLLSVWVIARLLDGVTGLRLLGSCASLAGLVLSKMSAVLVLPMALLLVVWLAPRGRPWGLRLGGWRRDARTVSAQLAALALLVLLHAAVVWAAVWTSYGWRYEALAAGRSPGDHLEAGVPNLLAGSGALGATVGFAERHHLLPEAYLYGFSYAVDQSAKRLAFLAGRRGETGWWWFFPYAFAVKTPESLLCLLLLAAAAAWTAAPRGGRRPALREGLRRTAPLWVLLAVYGGVAVGSRLNIGHRHLLPLYPALFVLCGAAARWLTAREVWRRALVGAVLVLVGVTGIAAWPDYLAYFNRLSGGPERGYRHLVDSSLDWGQDLPALAGWIAAQGLDRPGAEPVYLAYFGSASPEHYGVHARRLPGFFDLDRRQVLVPLEAGVYCISASMLELYGAVGTAPWGAGEEAEYDALRSRLAPLLAGGAAVPYAGPDVARYDRLRLARLLATLRRRPPDAAVGHSILIFRLDGAELRRALEGPPPASA